MLSSQGSLAPYQLAPPPIPFQMATQSEVNYFINELMKNSAPHGKKKFLFAYLLFTVISGVFASEFVSLARGIFLGESNSYMARLSQIQDCYAYSSSFYGCGIAAWSLAVWSGFVFLINLFSSWNAGICVLIQILQFLLCLNFLITSKMATCNSYSMGPAPFQQLLALTVISFCGMVAVFLYEKQKDQASRNKKNLSLIMKK